MTAILVKPDNGIENFDLSAQPLLGARSETSTAYDLMKKIGYPLSLCFFIFTLIVQLHQYKHISRQKKTISKHLDRLIGIVIVAGLIMLYLDLVLRTWLIIDFKGCKGKDSIKSIIFISLTYSFLLNRTHMGIIRTGLTWRYF